MAGIVHSELSGVGGCSVSDTFRFGQTGPGDVYGINDDGVFFVKLREKGLAYGETDVTESVVSWRSNGPMNLLEAQQRGIEFDLSTDACAMWGINFAGTLLVKQAGGHSHCLYLPGVRTYDPSGRTGRFFNVHHTFEKQGRQ